MSPSPPGWKAGAA
ncbi:056edbc6-0d7d-4f0c-856b-9a4079a74796 [Thermothielavioides terrestris]|uniref:056edbc6-0d7d-4f0c-856b-9a4079a74796 n=1 Tax=Thermothielavioides terrestris TaxID=2587410 RepID=A0A446BHL2_9PEZI|nr:056edbc6-0d7d-4f0c-856b-9a4079a74796 [Thermothielavioides terrestris]